MAYHTCIPPRFSEILPYPTLRMATPIQPLYSARCHDALRFSCVMFNESVRHQPSCFNSLSYMHTPPPLFRILRHRRCLPTSYNLQASDASVLQLPSIPLSCRYIPKTDRG